MLSASKSKRRRPKKVKFVSKPKQEWRVKEQKRNWLEIPYDVMANILHRVGVYDILENAQKVCTTWRKIFKDPAMWRIIHMDDTFSNLNARTRLWEMCKNAVDRSQGQLVDLTIVGFADDELLEYVADRSSQLKRLEIACCYNAIYLSWTESLKKFPLLEELSLYSTTISEEGIETVGRCCPMLRTLKMNQEADRFWYGYGGEDDLLTILNETVLAVGHNLPELRHLELIGNNMTKHELKVILDGCPHLETLDLGQCLYIHLEGGLGKECSEKIKCLKLPNDSLEGCPYIKGNDGVTCEMEYGDSDYEYDGYSDYDHCTNHYCLGAYEDVGDGDGDDDSLDIEELEDMMVLMNMFE